MLDGRKRELAEGMSFELTDLLPASLCLVLEGTTSDPTEVS